MVGEEANILNLTPFREAIKSDRRDSCCRVIEIRNKMLL